MHDDGPLRLDRDGTWWHAETKITHARLARLLHRSIARDEAGDLIVTTGRDRLPIEIDDAPFTVRTIEAQASGLTLFLSDAETESLRCDDVVYMAPDGALYLPVKSGAYWARCTRSAAQALTQRVEGDAAAPTVALPDGAARLVVDAAFDRRAPPPAT